MSGEWVSALGSGRLPLLESLVINYVDNDEGADDVAAVAVIRDHPKLIKFYIEPSIISLSACAEILGTRPELTYLVNNNFRYEIAQCESSSHSPQMGCKIAIFSETVPAATVSSIANSCRYPIMELTASLFDNSSFFIVVSTMGTNLRRVALWLNNSSENDSIVHHLSETCPHLESLELRACTNLSNEGLSVIAENCQELSELKLSVLDDDIPLPITDSGVASLVLKIGDQLTTLSLDGLCRVATDSLLAMATQCTKLHTLQLFSTSISVEALENCLIRPNLLPSLKMLHIDPLESGALLSVLADSNGVDKRWKNVLISEAFA